MSSAVIILIACIIVNSFIGVVFKLFDRYQVNIPVAIVLNYIVCVITGSLFIGEFPISMASMDEPWFWVAAMLGFVFVTTFNLYGFTVKHFGIVIATIFQKISMIAPVVIALGWYGDTFTFTKIAGILLGIGSIVYLSTEQSDSSSEQQSSNKKLWLLPIATLLGSMIIDSTLYLLEVERIAPQGDARFVIHLFFFAFIAGIIMLSVNAFKNGLSVQAKDLWAGIGLGVPNFFSIYLLLLVIASGWEGSVVFPMNNVGILACSALFGFVLFREAVTRSKIIGLSLAILAIVLINI